MIGSSKPGFYSLSVAVAVGAHDQCESHIFLVYCSAIDLELLAYSKPPENGGFVSEVLPPVPNTSLFLI